ncbi:MAG: peptide transporter [Planctomycetota bacterium]|nr:peptide transporter [Planctomycetota bacterium]
MSELRLDKELEEFRSLMTVPSTFQDGFSWTALAGSVFIALLMVPGAMYMGLLAGQGIGGAAQWVTVILFIEVARRAHKTISRPELYVLFFMAGAAMGTPFSGLLWNQFYVQSEAVTSMGIAEHLAEVPWLAPTDPEVLATRSFFNAAWLPAIGIVLFSTIIGRFSGTVLGYGLFRIARDIEKLPFPMAPVAAQGITALAEQQSEESTRGHDDAKEGWKWRIFCVGGIMGLAFGAVYLALPAISGALLDKPISIFPIPFVDWTTKTETILPAVATGLSLDLGNVLVGMVLPFTAVVGSMIGLVVTIVLSSCVLYPLHKLPNYRKGMDTIATGFNTGIDFYMSFGIGVSLAIAIAGIVQVFRSLRAASALRKKQQAIRMEVDATAAIPKGRGDIPFPFVIATYFATSMIYILLSGYLIDWHPGVMIVLFCFAFLYTPAISYVTARLEGLAGQGVEIPMIREAAFILSGYTGGVKIWFLPVPMANYGGGASGYRVSELTGTKFWSLWKAEILLVPIVLVASIGFAQFIWGLAAIPGPEYPFAEKMWELQAANSSVILTSTLGRFSEFNQAINWTWIGTGTLTGGLLFALMSSLSAPVMMTYGLIRGIGGQMHGLVPQFIGALIGEFYFHRRLGAMYRQYTPVIMAGFSCGMGLVTILAVGFNFLAKAIIKIPY